MALKLDHSAFTSALFKKSKEKQVQLAEVVVPWSSDPSINAPLVASSFASKVQSKKRRRSPSPNSGTA